MQNKEIVVPSLITPVPQYIPPWPVPEYSDENTLKRLGQFEWITPEFSGFLKIERPYYRNIQRVNLCSFTGGVTLETIFDNLPRTYACPVWELIRFAIAYPHLQTDCPTFALGSIIDGRAFYINNGLSGRILGYDWVIKRSFSSNCAYLFFS